MANQNETPERCYPRFPREHVSWVADQLAEEPTQRRTPSAIKAVLSGYPQRRRDYISWAVEQLNEAQNTLRKNDTELASDIISEVIVVGLTFQELD